MQYVLIVLYIFLWDVPSRLSVRWLWGAGCSVQKAVVGGGGIGVIVDCLALGRCFVGFYVFGVIGGVIE